MRKSRASLNTHRERSGSERTRQLSIANSVSPSPTGLKVICWESLTHSLSSDCLFLCNISSMEFQGQYDDRSQSIVFINQIN